MLTIIGHVATTIMTAHTRDDRKGRMIQKLAAISIAIKRTERVMRVISDVMEATKPS